MTDRNSRRERSTFTHPAIQIARTRAWRTLLLRSAACAAASWAGVNIIGCASPFTPDKSATGIYADSVLARSLADGSLEARPGSSPTINQGVQELPRVDSPGPSTADATAAIATESTTTATSSSTPASSPGITQLNAPVVSTTNPDLSTQAGTNAAVVPDTQAAATLPSAPSATSDQAPTTQPESYGIPEPRVYLSLQEAVERALAHSLIIKVDSYNPAIREATVTEAQAGFDAVAFANVQWNNQNEPQVNTSANGHVQAVTATAGVRKETSSGATVQVSTGDSYQDIRNSANPTFIATNPSHLANVNVTVTQPLLRGFGASTTKANIFIAQRDQRIAQTNFRKQVITSVEQVEETYYNLVLSQVSVDIDERLLDNTLETYDRISARAIFDADRTQLMQAAAAVESRKADLIRARATFRNTSDQLKELLNDPDIDLRGNELLIPSDKPVSEPISFNISDAVAIALSQRSELQEARLNIEKTDIVVDFAKNDVLPQADLTGSIQWNGLSNGYDKAFSAAVDNPHFIDYGLGLKVEIPIGNRGKEAALRQHRSEKQQAVVTMLNVAQQVILDVKTQMRNLLTSYQEVQAREAARKAAGEELNAILLREKVGEKLSPEFLQLKLDAQQLLANAELSQLQAIVNYNISLARLEQAKGTLLDYDRIAIDQAPSKLPGYTNRIRFMGKTYPGGKEE